VVNTFVVRPLSVLLIEDSEPDAVLTEEAFEEARIAVKLVVVNDGAAAIEFLDAAARGQQPLPELIMLDLNLPKVSGLEVLAHIKSHAALKIIPVIVMTVSNSPVDLRNAYERHANSFISKPVDPDEFLATVRAIQDYWVTIVRLPTRA
jgi:CheY-like chemotaxis protein